MIASSAWACAASLSTVSSVNAAGTITQIERGGSSLAINSSIVLAPVAPSPASSSTALALTS